MNNGLSVSKATAACSGIFNVQATVGPYLSGSFTQITVPPQILIQMLYGEAHGQTTVGDTVSELAVGVALRNRFLYSGTSDFQGVATYQAAIPGQFDGINTSIMNGPAPELANATAIFANTTTVSVANATCFFSPTSAGWAAIQGSLAQPSTTLPTELVNGRQQMLVHDPQCYPPTSRQYVYKSSIGKNANGSGAPAFIFVQSRTSSSPSVIQIQ